MIFAKKAIDNRPLELDYIIYSIEEIHAEDILKLVEEIAHLQWLFKKYYFENPDKTTATSLPIDQCFLSASMTARLGAKVASLITFHRPTPTKNSHTIYKRIPNLINSLIRVCCSGQCPKFISKF